MGDKGTIVVLKVLPVPFPRKQDFVLSVAASPDGNYIASGSKDRAVQCWDIRTGKAQFVVHGHKNSVISIAMSEVGGFLATGSGDWQARLFKISGMDEPVTKPAISASIVSAHPQKQASAVLQPQQPGSEASAGATDSAALKKESATSETNGHDTSKESPAMANGTQAPKDAPQVKSTAAQDVTQDPVPPASTLANAPSSPSSMKIDAPATEVTSAEKTAVKETTTVSPKTIVVEAAPKDVSEETNGDSTMADSPPAQAAKA